MDPVLPIDAALPALLAALTAQRQAVLEAPPGAGKTTRVPLALLAAGIVEGRILMLEPRRLASRAAAERMASNLQQKVGQTVGFRIKGETRTSSQTRIEVVTEGILTRMIQSDPELAGVGMVIFDEFHERSLQADLGLALCLELRDILRPDLMILVMSATLETEPVARLMGDAPIICSRGKIFDVETRWLDRPWKKSGQRAPRFEAAMTDLVCDALINTTGGVLVFLPGEGEIKRVATALSPRVAQDCQIHPLYGSLGFNAQRAAIAPAKNGRKIVLATSIAETSLTIEDVRVVVDGGLARRAEFDPASGMSRLITERVTKAEATQRRGRAGRTAPGVCYRLWTRAEQGGLRAFPSPEIKNADLAPLLLETSLWGAADPAELKFLDAPSERALARARELLEKLGALSPSGRITKHGKRMSALPLHPRLAHMVLSGGRDAPKLAALLSERDIFTKGNFAISSDISLRLMALGDPKHFEKSHPFTVNMSTLARVKTDLKRLAANNDRALSAGEMAALAYPDRIGLRRKGDSGRFVLSGGRGAVIASDDPLSQSRLIVACDLDGDRKEAKIRLAASLDEACFRALYSDQITTRNICEWSARTRSVLARQQEVFGALLISERPWKDCPDAKFAQAMIAGIRDLGFDALNPSKSANLLISRVEWARAHGANMPDFSRTCLMRDAENWLAPYLASCRNAADLKMVDVKSALLTRLGWQRKTTLDQLAPATILAPTGTALAIDYAGAQPKISVRLQEMFGLASHPTIGPHHAALLIELLSPAQKPLQTTADLPGFWQSSYNDVRKDMRGRYPKHPWPENPLQAAPTRRAKPKKR